MAGLKFFLFLLSFAILRVDGLKTRKWNKRIANATIMGIIKISTSIGR
jgi:hypothetical protein